AFLSLPASLAATGFEDFASFEAFAVGFASADFFAAGLAAVFDGAALACAFGLSCGSLVDEVDCCAQQLPPAKTQISPSAAMARWSFLCRGAEREGRAVVIVLGRGD